MQPRDGDLLLLRGGAPQSRLVQCALCSPYSHVALALRVCGELCAVHCSVNHMRTRDVVLDTAFSGVRATRLADEQASGYYCAIDVWRVPGALEAAPELRSALAGLYGTPYERSPCALACVVCKCASVVTVSMSCAEFVGTLMQRAGLVPPLADVHLMDPTDLLQLRGAEHVGALSVACPPFRRRLTPRRRAPDLRPTAVALARQALAAGRGSTRARGRRPRR